MAKKEITKSRLAKALTSEKNNKRSKKEYYWPSKEEAIRWHHIINREVFDGCLDEKIEIDVRRRHGVYGECQGYLEDEKHVVTISFNHWFKSKKHFIECVVHEMVHQYQWEQLHEMTHGKSFYAWQPKLQKYGMLLMEKQK